MEDMMYMILSLLVNISLESLLKDINLILHYKMLYSFMIEHLFLHINLMKLTPENKLLVHCIMIHPLLI